MKQGLVKGPNRPVRSHQTSPQPCSRLTLPKSSYTSPMHQCCFLLLRKVTVQTCQNTLSLSPTKHWMNIHQPLGNRLPIVAVPITCNCVFRYKAYIWRDKHSLWSSALCLTHANKRIYDKNVSSVIHSNSDARDVLSVWLQGKGEEGRGHILWTTQASEPYQWSEIKLFTRHIFPAVPGQATEDWVRNNNVPLFRKKSSGRLDALVKLQQGG